MAWFLLRCLSASAIGLVLLVRGAAAEGEGAAPPFRMPLNGEYRQNLLHSELCRS